MKTTRLIGLLALAAALAASQCAAAENPAYADPTERGLPKTDMKVSLSDTALVITDPQIDFLSPDGVAWAVVGESVTEQQTVPHIEQLLKAAQSKGMMIAISPHFYYPHDHRWHFGAPLEKVMHGLHMFDLPGPLMMEELEGSGADFMPQYKKYLFDGKTVIVSPHKIYGPEQNDLVLQLRKRGIDKVVLCGMSANLCVQAHLHELLEQGFEVAVVQDATAAAKFPEGDGYLAALINYRFMANALWKTKEAVARIDAAQ